MPFFRRREAEVDFVVEARFKVRLAVGVFYMPLARTFMTMAVTGIVTYAVIFQINTNLSEGAVGLQTMSSNETSNEPGFHCSSAINCGAIALVVQLFLVLPLSLYNLSSGCRVLARTPIRFSRVRKHRDRLMMWSIYALITVFVAFYFSWSDHFIIFCMTPVLVFNYVEVWYICQLFWQMDKDKVERSWHASQGTELIATNEQWRSLIQNHDNDEDVVEYDILDTPLH